MTMQSFPAHGLEDFKDRFAHPDPDLTYLDGNSLGRMPLAAADLAASLVEGWAVDLIRGWNLGWMDVSARLGNKVAKIIGVPQDTVVIADSTSVNLYKLIVAGLATQKGRSTIVTDDLNFPSDLYLLQQAAGDTHDLKVVASNGVDGPVEGLLAALDESVALITLSATAFHSGYTYDTRAITDAAHAVGAMVLWDLSHTAGSVPVDLSGADLAVGCCYKYLNGGPGAPAFLHVRKDLIERLENPIQGWMGHEDMFAFSHEFSATPSIRRFLTGTPPLISMALIEPGLDLHLEAGGDRVRSASVQLTDRFVAAFDRTLSDRGFELLSPRDHRHRGSHITLGHRHALAIDQALINDYSVIPDFRPSNGIRFGFAPLYNTMEDVDRAIAALTEITDTGSWQRYKGATPRVT